MNRLGICIYYCLHFNRVHVIPVASVLGLGTRLIALTGCRHW